MNVAAAAREQVRRRANYVCEFCGVSEADTGGELTIDHFQPKSKGGSDDISNLLYCCPRCNQYKQGYWPESSPEVALWNPRQEPRTAHFVELDTGHLLALTPIGEFTLKRLRLNRTPLIQYRLHARQRADERRLLRRYQELVQSLEQLNSQLGELVEEQQALLEEQNELLKYYRRRSEQ